MELNNNDAAVRADSIDSPSASSGAGELDLYNELTAFAELSPDEQLRFVADPERASSETEKTSGAEIKKTSATEPVLTQERIEPVEEEATPAEKAEEAPSPKPILTQAPIQPVAEEATSAEKAEETSSSEPILTQAAPIELVAEQATSAEKAQETPSSKSILAHSAIDPVEEETTVPAAESSSNSNVSIESIRVSQGLSELSRPSGPLGSLILPPEFVFAGALSRGICLACGVETGAAEDLFCLTCGVFIDELGSTIPVATTCEECKHEIEPDEIFCPWCGSVLPA